jgi:RecB family exonuclease
VRGIIDRLDLVRDPTTTGTTKVVLRLCDYKTGKAPDLKYSPAVNQRIREENFYQLFIYALLMREKGDHPAEPMDLRFLRLFYMTTANDPKQAKWLDYDLGETQEERDVKLNTIHEDLAQTWFDIKQLCEANDPLQWKPCKRSFCYCHRCRPRFETGTLAEPS